MSRLSLTTAPPLALPAWSRRPRRPRRYTPLLWRVFAANAAVLLTMATVSILAQSPGTISPTIVVREFPFITSGLVAMLITNLVLIRRTIRPLDRLMELTRRVDPLKPGQRVHLDGPKSEATELAESFNGMLERLEGEHEESTRRALAAQETERLRVAQELHDEIGQGLTAALLQLGGLRKRAGVVGDVNAQVADAEETVRAQLEEVRRIARGLRPEALVELGLVAALRAFGRRLGQQTSLQLSLTLEPPPSPLTYEQELVIYRVAQEALTNVVRHSGAGHAELILAPGGRGIALEVADNGRGVADHAQRAGGVRGMYERALMIDATLSIDSEHHDGTRVRLDVPLP